jgi:ABC-type protease/lipase transport system fused ATPase/permease subunit
LEKFEQEEQIKREAQMVSKLSVEQCAAQEWQQEREQMLKVVKQKQSEAKGQDGRSFEKEK